MHVKLSKKIQVLINIFNQNLLFLHLDNFVKLLLSFVLGLLIANIYGPNLYGVFCYVLSLVGIFTTLSSLGMKNILIRNIVNYNSSNLKILGSGFLIHLISSIIFFLILLVSNNCFYIIDNNYKTFINILATIILFKSFEIFYYWYEAKMNVRKIVSYKIMILLLFNIMKMYILFAELGLFFIFALFTIESITISLLYYLVWRIDNLKTNLKFNYGLIKKILYDSCPLFFAVVSVSLYTKMDQIMIANLLNEKSVGIYAASSRLVDAIVSVIGVFTIAFFPKILLHRKFSLFNYYIYLSKLFKIFTIISMFLALLIFLTSHFLINLLYGSEYAESIIVLKIVSFTIIFISMGVISSKWIVAENKQYLSFQRTIVGLFINLILNYVLIKKMGVIGAAYATLFTQCITAFLIDYLQKETRLMFQLKIFAFIPFINYDKKLLSKV